MKTTGYLIEQILQGYPIGLVLEANYLKTPKMWRKGETFQMVSTEYDVALAIYIIRNYPEHVGLTQIDVDKWMKTWGGWINIDDKYAAKRDIKKPLIAVVEKDGALIIDGWHRLRKAQMLGKKTLPVYVIDDPVLVKMLKTGSLATVKKKLSKYKKESLFWEAKNYSTFFTDVVNDTARDNYVNFIYDADRGRYYYSQLSHEQIVFNHHMDWYSAPIMGRVKKDKKGNATVYVRPPSDFEGYLDLPRSDRRDIMRFYDAGVSLLVKNLRKAGYPPKVRSFW